MPPPVIVRAQRQRKAKNGLRNFVRLLKKRMKIGDGRAKLSQSGVFAVRNAHPGPDETIERAVPRAISSCNPERSRKTNEAYRDRSGGGPGPRHGLRARRGPGGHLRPRR